MARAGFWQIAISSGAFAYRQLNDGPPSDCALVAVHNEDASIIKAITLMFFM
jgi:hypothetical protein